MNEELSLSEVEYVAKLASLELTVEEKRRFASELSRVLQYFGKLRELNTEGVEATFQVVPATNVFREDEIISSSITEEVLENAPMRENDYFKVPPIL